MPGAWAFAGRRCAGAELRLHEGRGEDADDQVHVLVHAHLDADADADVNADVHVRRRASVGAPGC